MLKRLSNRLRLFLIGILMGIITMILCFSFWSHCQSRQMGDITYLQRMASLIIYQLEANPENLETLLTDYEEKMQIYSVLTDARGSLLHESQAKLPTDLSALVDTAGESIDIQDAASRQTEGAATQQGGLVAVSGQHHDHYFIIPATIHTQSGDIYHLALCCQRATVLSLLLHQAPLYLGIWFLSFFCVLSVSRFLLRKAFQPTEQILQSQKDFVAAASHELKSPLAVIMANAETLQSIGGWDGTVQASLAAIDFECARMSRLVRDMLLLASSDADKWTLRREKVNVDTLLITLYEAYEPVCIRHSLRLSLEVGEESYPVLYTDRERLFQILSIYLDNAVSYSPEGSTIEIYTELTARELTFSISDHGAGIAESDRPFLFDRFYRADKSRTDKSHFGLGLSIAKELAKMLNGKIGFRDTPGGGATFFLSLPVPGKSDHSRNPGRPVP